MGCLKLTYYNGESPLVESGKLFLVHREKSASGSEKGKDYSTGGAPLPGRTFNSTEYRFGFNGKEKDDEISGSGNQYDYGFRIYNPRLGRFLSIDPIAKDYPWYTPYQFASNSPISLIDIDGKEGVFPFFTSDPGGLFVFQMKAFEVSKRIVKNTIIALFAPFDAISYDHYTGNIKDPKLKYEYSEKAKEAYLQTITDGIIGLGIGKIFGVARYLVKNSRIDRVFVRTAEEVNEAFTKKGMKAPYETGAPVVEVAAKEDIKLVRVSTENNIEGVWFADPEQIKGLTPGQIKDKLGLKYEPTTITEVTIKEGAKVRIGTAAEVSEFGAKGGGVQIELLEGKVEYGKSKSLQKIEKNSKQIKAGSN